MSPHRNTRPASPSDSRPASSSDVPSDSRTDHRRPAGRTLGAFAAVGVAVLVTAGCGSAASKTTSAPATTGGPAASSLAPAPTSAGAPSKVTGSPVVASKITAKLTEFHIALSDTKVSAGRYTFVAVNAGHTVHSLEIDGPGVHDAALGGALQPGQSANLTVTLQAGTYDVFCPVGDHKALGMNLELTVGAAGGASASGAAASAVDSPATTVPAPTTTGAPSGNGY